MPTIELIYDHDCPNVEAARQVLRQALSQTGLSASWTEWNRSDPASPRYVQGYGSPTILVDGQDAAGQPPATGGASCRVYLSDARTSGTPSLAMLSGALAGKTSGFRWRHVLPTIPGVGAALLPVGVCPACWPAYAGLLSAVGLGFFLETIYLLPLTIGLFAVAVASLAYRAPSRRGYGPLVVGLLGATTATVGKFALNVDALLYVGLGALLIGSVWNSWPRTMAAMSSCGACAPPMPDPACHAHNEE